MTRSRTSYDELLVSLDRTDPRSLHHQLEGALRDAIRIGRLEPRSAVPSSRSLAAQLRLSRGVVVEAYEQLVAEGYLVSRPGGATTVAETSVGEVAVEPAPPPPAHRVDFRYGRPDLGEFPRDAWLRSLRRVLNDAPTARLGYPDLRGVPELREALAVYANRVRATAATPGRVVVCSGVMQAIGLVCRVLHDRGARRLAIEDPADNTTRDIIRAAGLEVVGIPVDEDGIRIEELDRVDVDIVLVTPAHQFPTGAVMSPERRAALVAWATRTGSLIIEDDYDAEYRYDREPIGAIEGLAPDRVVYCGSVSKILAPGLRIGWLVAPANLVDAITDAKGLADFGSPAIDQLAFADFLARGELDRFLRRLRPVYRRRRDALLGAMRRNTPALRPVGIDAGLHVITWLPPGVEESAVVEAARARSLGVYGLGIHWIEPEGKAAALLFGYSSLREATIEEGIGLLADALRDVQADNLR